MKQWLQYRPIFLDEFLHLDGLGDALNGLGVCPDCSKTLAGFRCKDCFGGALRCSACIVSLHQDLPLHRLQVCKDFWITLTDGLIQPKSWNGSFFEGTTLESLGFIINLGHNVDICPVNPETQRVTVIDLSGYHLVRVRFCMCSQSSFLEPFRQLLRVHWYPASILRPKTVFTFDLLDTYHKISLQGKVNLYDFYNTIMQKTDNCGRLGAQVSRFTGCSHHIAYTC